MVLVCALLTLAGCESPPKVQSESDPGLDVSGYASFAVLPLPDRISGADPGAVLRTRRTVNEAVVESLLAKGYTQVPQEKADFMVNITGKVVPTVDISTMGYVPVGRVYPRGAVYGGYRQAVSVDQYNEGTLVLEIYDSATKQMAWVGWSSNRVASGGPDPAALRDVVTRILAQFPNRSRAP
jgi:hypothetical protein